MDKDKENKEKMQKLQIQFEKLILENGKNLFYNFIYV